MFNCEKDKENSLSHENEYKFLQLGSVSQVCIFRISNNEETKSVQRTLFLSCLQGKKKLKLYSLFSVYCDKGKSNEVNHELHTPSKAEGIKVHALLMAEEEFPFSLAVI